MFIVSLARVAFGYIDKVTVFETYILPKNIREKSLSQFRTIREELKVHLNEKQ